MTGPRDFDRLEAERLGRLQSCFNADRPQNNEIRAALQRWHLSQIRRTQTLPVRAAWVIAGAMLLSGAAMAATRVAQLPVWSSLVSASKPPSPATSSASSAHPRCFVQHAGRRFECKSAADLKLAPGEQAALIVNDVKTELVGPGVAHLRFDVKSGTWVSRFEPQSSLSATDSVQTMPATRDSDARSVPVEGDATRRIAPKPSAAVVAVAAKGEPSSTPEPGAPAVANPSPASSLDGAWSRAASALRRGDNLEARAALSEISRSSDPAARDSASLAQAQLDLAAGRKDKALPLLNELARSGATAFVRQRAQEIIVSGK